MTATYDFVMGLSPQIKPEVCKANRIGYDRVWHVAVRLMSYANRKSGLFYPSHERIARESCMSVGAVRTAIRVLSESGVIERYDGHWAGEDANRAERAAFPKYRTQRYRAAWNVSHKRLDFYLADVDEEIDPDACREAGVGLDRAWRLAVLNRIRKRTARGFAALLGWSEKMVYKAARAAGIALRKSSRKRRQTTESVVLGTSFLSPDPVLHTNSQAVCSSQSLPSVKPASRNAREAGCTKTTSPKRQTRTERAQSRLFRTFEALRHLGKESTIMPYEIFADSEPHIEPVSTESLRNLKSKHRVPKAKRAKIHRQDRPLDTWTPMDMVNEFRASVQVRPRWTVEDLGDSVDLAKSLGRMRKKYGYDGRVEAIVLREMIKDGEMSSKREVPMWLKFLQRLKTTHEAALVKVTRMDRVRTEGTEEHDRAEARRRTEDEIRRKHEAIRAENARADAAKEAAEAAEAAYEARYRAMEDSYEGAWRRTWDAHVEAVRAYDALHAEKSAALFAARGITPDEDWDVDALVWDEVASEIGPSPLENPPVKPPPPAEWVAMQAELSAKVDAKIAADKARTKAVYDAVMASSSTG